MAQYMISVWYDEDYELDFSDPDAQRRVAQVAAFNEALVDAGSLVFAAGLHPRDTASVMRPSRGSVEMTDGPYADSPQHMGGFWIVEASDLEGAQEWARRAATACEAAVELRPLQSD